MKTKVFLVLLLIYSSFFRVSFINHPFWVDEFSSSIQARLINTFGLIGFFEQTDYYAEPNNILSHVLIALSFLSFGEQEWVARLPFMIIGSLVPIMVFFLSRALFDTRAAVMSSLLSATSYFMITWSRQARGYPLQQLFLLILLFLYIQYQRTKEIKYGILLAITAILGIATHYFFGLFVLIIITSLFFKNFLEINNHFKVLLTALLTLFIIGIFTGLFENAFLTLQNILNQGASNNLWYYHALLWKQETLISFFAVLGVFFVFLKKNYSAFILVLCIVLQLVVITFVLPAYTSRYISPVFPLLIILAGFSIAQIADGAGREFKVRQLSSLIALGITLFIIGNGGNFDLKPSPYYSINHTMRDIALVDYNQAYAKITLAKEKYPNLALIETWVDRARWYLGKDFENLYWFRWLANEGTINGITLTTNAIQNNAGIYEVQLTGPRKIPLIASLADLLRVVSQHPQGFIWIDDTSMSAEVIQYAQENFKKELYLQQYQFDDNPYSIWPATLYSWGIEDTADTSL